MTCQEVTPRTEGFAAFHFGTDRFQCPYPPNTPEANDWCEGWNSAHAERNRILDAQEISQRLIE